ncbi:MAG TPA: zinc-binding alcohol dehydrogenase family protein [Archangium sp.]|jgi:NADPH:quinone reductase-like Zn-dependent oxidoreductase|uniref:quinone oxidoreductase family protein n=1 Tax=Archangium sp. TaxID=1872627 RepID=UPI002ED78E8F
MNANLPESMRALRFHRTGGPEVLQLETLPLPRPRHDEVLVEVHAAAINPSDVKNVAGSMEKTTLPRTPGRDFAGRVVAGPEGWVGAEVFGTSGELGFVRDGAHAEYVVARVDGVRRKPAALSMAEAASIGVPYVTAWEGLRLAGLQAGDTVLVVGGTGAVGRATAQLARWSGARVLATAQGARAADESFRRAVDRVIDLEHEELVAAVKDATGGRGVDIVCNMVGGPTFAPGVASLAIGGRLVVVASTPETEVRFDLRAFYRRQLQFLGVDSLKMSEAAAAHILGRLMPGFVSGALWATVGRTVPLKDAVEAYRDVQQRGAGKYVLLP